MFKNYIECYRCSGCIETKTNLSLRPTWTTPQNGKSDYCLTSTNKNISIYVCFLCTYFCWSTTKELTPH